MINQRLLVGYVGILSAIMLLIVVHAPLSVAFGSLWSEASLYIKAWKELLLLVALAMAVLLVSQAGQWRQLFADRLLWLIAAYASLHLLMLGLSTSLLGAVAGLMIDLRYILYFLLVYVAIKLLPSAAAWLQRMAVAGAVIVVGFAIVQLFLPPDALRVIGYGEDTIMPYMTIDSNDDFIRYQSTLRGPNPLGAYAASVAAVGLAWLTVRRRKFDWRIATLTGAAILATYISHSRSAFIALAVGLAVVGLARYWSRIQIWHWMTAAVLVVGMLTAGYAYRDNTFISNVLIHEDPTEGNDYNSNDGHIQSLQNGTDRMLNEPFGGGIGSTGSASLLSDQPRIIENQYLLVAHEVGWLGLALFLAIFIVIMRRLWRLRSDPWALGLFASGVGLAMIGVLLPVWVDDTVSIVWWGLAAVALQVSSANHRSSKN